MRIASSFILILAFPATLYGWGGEGHQIVALIAEDHLSPAAKQGIVDLLGKGNHISDAEIASWADEYRRQDRSTGPWHFVDIPVSAATFDEQRDGAGGNNVIDKINDFAAVLADPKASKPKRAEALKFVVHLVGDEHQPLHCADRNDKGGNSRLVFLLGQPRATNLHSVWDSGILRLDERGRRVSEYADALNGNITPAMKKEWKAGTVTDWANESHAVAVSTVYAGVPASGPPPKLDQAYVDRGEAAIELQLERGGVRLAEVLNRAFAVQATTRPASRQAQ